MSQAVRIPVATLFVSEPSPGMFGNPANKPTKDWTNANWLKSRFHFNFAEHMTGRERFGVLRVMNDDLVQPLRGFGEHPHRDMEILTYIVSGYLTHRDSTGSVETLGRGSIQFMSAGTGVRHSETNNSPDTPVRFIQSWVLPRRRGLPAAYGSYTPPEPYNRNSWIHLVSDAASPALSTPIKVQQDVNMFIAQIDSGVSSPFPLRPERMAYMLIIEGEAEIDGTRCSEGDGVELFGVADGFVPITTGSPGAHLIVFEMAR